MPLSVPTRMGELSPQKFNLKMEIDSKFVWGMSQKSDGQMIIYLEDRDNAKTNREKFFAGLGLDFRRMITAGLAHGHNITVVGEKECGQKILNTDGLISSDPNIILTVTGADCQPLYFFDEKNKVIGMAHAGWRGVEQNIAGKMVEKLKTEFGSKPEDIKVKIGPHIRKCHFEIGEDVAVQFADYQNFITREGVSIKLDLSAVVADQLKKVGVTAINIDISEECTYCLKDKYYSFRRDHPERVEAMVAYVVMK